MTITKRPLTADDAKVANDAMDHLLRAMNPRCKRDLDAGALNTVCLFLERACRELPESHA